MGSSSVAEGDFFILISEISSSGAGQKCYWIVDHLRKTSDFTMLSVNGQQFSPEKVLFLPRPTRVFKLFVWLVKSRLNPRWISGESHLNLKMSYLFLCSILTLFAGYSQPINKNRYKKSEVILNLFQGYSKLILNLFQKVLFIFGMKWQFVAT